MTLSALDTAELIKNGMPFQKLADNYKDLLVKNALPFSVDINLLSTIIKTQLFDKLLSADKGLRMRYEMIKSDGGKFKLINDTIDLTGYDIIPELQTAITELQRHYRQLYASGGFVHQYMSFDDFATVKELNFISLARAWQIDWTGNEQALTTFNNLIPALTQLRTAFQAAFNTGHNLHTTLSELSQFYVNSGEGERFEANEVAVWGLLNRLKTAGKITMFNKK